MCCLHLYYRHFENPQTIEILKKQEREKGRSEEQAKAEAEKLAEKKVSAIKMLQSGFDSKMISDILNFPIKEIEKLK